MDNKTFFQLGYTSIQGLDQESKVRYLNRKVHGYGILSRIITAGATQYYTHCYLTIF